MVGERFVVEADRKIVGVAVRVPGGFRFFSSDPDFQELDARTFARSRIMARHVAELARLLRVTGRARREAGAEEAIH